MAFVGRARALSRLLRRGRGGCGGRARLVLVAGEAGIGKTTLVSEAAARSGWAVGLGHLRRRRAGARVLGVVHRVARPPGRRSGPDGDGGACPTSGELARLLPELARTGSAAEPSVRRHRGGAAAAVRRGRPAPGAARRACARVRRARRPAVGRRLDARAAAVRRAALPAGAAGDRRRLPARRADRAARRELRRARRPRRRGAARPGCPLPRWRRWSPTSRASRPPTRWAAEVHRRTDGHPFFARQLTDLLVERGARGGGARRAVRDVVGRRVRAAVRGVPRAGGGGRGGGQRVDARRAGRRVGPRRGHRHPAHGGGRAAGVLVRDADGATPGSRTTSSARRSRPGWPSRDGCCCTSASPTRSNSVRPAAPPSPPPIWPATRPRPRRWRAATGPCGWARRAARAESRPPGLRGGGRPPGQGPARRRGHRGAGRGRACSSTCSSRRPTPAPARAIRTGRETLLDDARGRASACGDAERLARVALGVQRLGARFAMPRDAVVEELEAALAAAVRAAAPRWRPTSPRASRASCTTRSPPSGRGPARCRSRRSPSPAPSTTPRTLAACLLARHDMLWTPGPGGGADRDRRGRSASWPRAPGDAERHAEGLLLTANALLEQGSAAFRSALADFLRAADGFRQPRHDYLAMTRRGALALIDGRLDEAERLIAAASALGERIGEPDAGNVRMSQLLGLVRARRDPERLRAIAGEAVRWWVGVPSHAHAVAAGFLARTGDPDDLDAARRALDTVVALDTWRADRSYLWSVFVGEMTTAAVRLGDRAVCAQLLAELEPITDTCGVNGALVCFMGSNAHWAGMLAAALDRPDDARRLLHQALDVHHRLGAAALGGRDRARAGRARRPGAAPTEAGPGPRGRPVVCAPPRRVRAPARPQGAGRPGRAARPPRRRRARLELAARGRTTARAATCSTRPPAPPTGAGSPSSTRTSPARERRPRPRPGRAAGPRTRRRAGRAAPRGGPRRPGPRVGDEHQRAGAQGRHGQGPRGDPPHRGRAARPRRAPRPLGADRHHLPLRADRAGELDPAGRPPPSVTNPRSRPPIRDSRADRPRPGDGRPAIGRRCAHLRVTPCALAASDVVLSIPGRDGG